MSLEEATTLLSFGGCVIFILSISLVLKCFKCNSLETDLLEEQSDYMWYKERARINKDMYKKLFEDELKRSQGLHSQCKRWKKAYLDLKRQR